MFDILTNFVADPPNALLHDKFSRIMNSQSISALLEENRSEIDALKSLVNDVLEAEHDDIFLLRFILSNKTAVEAEEPVRFTIKWYKEHAEVIENIKNGGKIPNHDQMRKFTVSDDHKMTKHGEPIFYVRIGLCNTKALMDVFSVEQVLEYQMLQRVKSLFYCDQESRKRGKFVRVVSVLDFNGFSLLRGNDSRFNKVIGQGSKLSEKLFPQLLGKSIFINCPSVFSLVFAIVKPLMSKRAVEKMVFCPGNTKGKLIDACPYVAANVSIKDIPTFLGGECNCTGGCIGVPNSQTLPNDQDKDGLMQLTVPRSSKETIRLPVPKGSVVKYKLDPEEKLGVTVSFESPNLASKPLTSIKSDQEKSESQIQGKCIAEEVGDLVIVLENTSFFKSKKCAYSVDLE